MGKQLWFWVTLVIVIWFSAFSLHLFFGTELAGVVGDSFGVVNTLFSGLAFALLIYTSWMQKEELKLQRQELADTREELKLSREAHEAQAQLLESQIQGEGTRREQEVMPYLELKVERVKGDRERYHVRVLVTVQLNAIFFEDFEVSYLDVPANEPAKDVLPSHTMPDTQVYAPMTTFFLDFHIPHWQWEKRCYSLRFTYRSIYNTKYSQTFAVLHDKVQGQIPVKAVVK